MKVFMAGHHAHVGVFGKPHLKLSDFLIQCGWELVENEEQADVICAVEVPMGRLTKTKIPVGARNKGLLVIQEPDVVWPSNSNRKALDRFAAIIEVGRPHDGTKWPLIWPVMREHFREDLKIPRACMIAGGKLSLIQGELYSLRREVILSSASVDLYGQGWQKSVLQKLKDITYQCVILVASGKPVSRQGLRHYFKTVKNYRGPIEDKISVNSNYKVSVVIENSASYMSEKLLEAMVAGSIPVYVGPDPSLFGIPRELYVLSGPSQPSVEEAVQEAMKMDYGSWATAALSFLECNVVQQGWGLEAYWERIHNALVGLLESNSPPVN